MNMMFRFRKQKQAEDFVAVVKNRFGLAAFTYNDAAAHVLGADHDEIERQVEDLGCWLSVSNKTADR
jgi:hypothetical protein